MKKYEFTGETKKTGLFGQITLHRIRAVVEFGMIKVGDLGGWIEKEENLSHENKSWIYGNAEVWGNAKVCGNAKVWGNAEVYGNAEVWGDAKVYGNAEVWGNAEVYGNAEVWGNAEVCGDAEVWGDAKVYGNAEVWGNAEVYGNAEVWGNAEVCGDAKAYGNAEVCGNAEVYKVSHVLFFGPAGSRNDITTFFRDKDNEITVKCGCFLGKMDKFLSEVAKTHGDNKYALVYRAAAETAKLQIDLSSDDKGEGNEENCTEKTED